MMDFDDFCEFWVVFAFTPIIIIMFIVLLLPNEADALKETLVGFQLTLLASQLFAAWKALT